MKVTIEMMPEIIFCAFCLLGSFLATLVFKLVKCHTSHREPKGREKRENQAPDKAIGHELDNHKACTSRDDE